jgi:cytochrome b561
VASGSDMGRPNIITTSANRLYSPLQIALHWIVAFLVLGQRLTSDAIYRTHNPFLRRTVTDLLEHTYHNYAGILIGLLMAARLLLRFLRRGQARRASSSLSERLALSLHYAFYVIVLVQAGTGFMAGYVWSGVGSLHSALWTVLLVLIALHILAAALHGIRKDGVLSRMLPSSRL